MFNAFMISLREGVEIAIVLAVILAYLKQIGNKEASKQVWTGTAVAIVLSILIAIGIFIIMGETETENFQAVLEGILKILSVIILTWMTLWMKRQSKDIASELKHQIDQALNNGSVWTLAFLAFISVIREGIETALFIVGSALETSVSGTIIGALIGFGLASIIGYLIYNGTNRLPLKTFFTVLSVLLIFMAAGLLSGGIHEFQELGLIPEGIHLWNLHYILSESSVLGSLMKAIFGYRESPNLLLVTSYSIYIPFALYAYFKPAKY